MARFGRETSFYIQDELLLKVEQILAKNRDIFSSRSHFFNCAITRELRRIDKHAPFHTDEEKSKG